MADHGNEGGAVGGVVEQLENENEASQVHHHHYYYPIFFGGIHSPVQGNVVQSLNITSANIGSVQVNQSQPQEPEIERQSSSNAALASALLHFMQALNLPQDLRRQTVAALRNNDHQTSQQHRREPAADSSAAITGVQILTDDAINQLKKMKLDENVETVMKEGFEALIRDDETKKSTMDFIQAYVDEVNETSADVKEKFKELNPLLEQVWNDIYLKIAIATCERHLEENSGLSCALAKICLFLAKRMQEQKREQVLSFFSNKTKEASKVREPLYGETKPIRDIVLRYAVAKLHQIDNKGKDSAAGILDSVVFSLRILLQMWKTGTLYQFHKDHVITLVLEIIGFMETITGLSKEQRVENEVWCLHCSGWCRFLQDDYDQAAEQGESAIDLMEREVKEKAPTFVIYGYCLYSYAMIHRGKGDIDGLRKATDLFNRSIQAVAKARDWPSDQEKDNFGESIERELKQCEEELQQRLESE